MLQGPPDVRQPPAAGVPLPKAALRSGKGLLNPDGIPVPHVPDGFRRFSSAVSGSENAITPSTTSCSSFS